MSMKSQVKALTPECPRSFDAGFSAPVCGIDEVGRGPLAGPVVAACVFIPEEAKDLSFWQIVTDSKKLSAKKREMLYGEITACCACSIAEISPAEIDELNIHHATLKAMKGAFEQICHPERSEGSKILRAQGPQDDNILCLIDGKFAPDIPCRAQTVIKGDSKSLSIAAASIIAKVHRDRLMATLHEQHPHYGWDRNAGYGTAQHLEGIRLHGITPHHRRSFAPCK